MANHDAGRTGILVADMEDWSMNEKPEILELKDRIIVDQWEHNMYVKMQYMINLFDRMSSAKKSMSINDARMIFELDPLPEEPAPPWEQEFDPGESPEAV